MKKCLLFLAVIATTTVGYSQDEIKWSEHRRLTWDDYNNRTGQGGFFKAFTYSGIRYQVETPGDYVEISIESYFLPNDSWVHLDKASSKLLAHEQGHFDITEIYARRMRKEMEIYQTSARRFVDNNYLVDVKRIYEDLYADMERKQDDYDRQTEHSIKETAQQAWEKWIENQLKDLEDYAE